MELKIAAKDVQANDEIKTGDGYLKVGGVMALGEDRVGLMTPEGMLGVDAEDIVTVRRT
jgi:hypothetical protein